MAYPVHGAASGVSTAKSPMAYSGLNGLSLSSSELIHPSMQYPGEYSNILIFTREVHSI